MLYKEENPKKFVKKKVPAASNKEDSHEAKNKESSEKASKRSSKPTYKLEPMNCLVTKDTKRPPLFNDLTDWVYKYRRHYHIGSFYEFLLITPDTSSPIDLDDLKAIAEDGLHYKEVAMMETVFKAGIHNNHPPSKEKKIDRKLSIAKS